MKRLALIALLLLTLTLAIACGSATPVANTSHGARSATDNLQGGLPIAPIPAAQPTMAAAATAAPAQPPTFSEGAGSKATDQNVTQALDQASTQRMVVYTGTLSLEVQDTETTVSKINDILTANQGYVSSRSLDRDDQGKLRGSITIRVPAGSLNAVLTQIKALAIKTLHEDAQSADVTQEYVDLDARRKNLEAYEVELTKLLDTVRENSGKAQDLLAVYNQLTEVRGQIEQIKGRQNYLQNTSDLATYTVQFVPHEEVPVTNEGWDPLNTARSSLHSLVVSLQGLADIGIALLLYVVPLMLIFIIPLVIVFWIARRVWRSRMPKRVATA